MCCSHFSFHISLFKTLTAKYHDHYCKHTHQHIHLSQPLLNFIYFRWGLSGNFVRFLGTQTGITGFISFVLTFVIVWPMRLNWIKQRMTYEWRKGLHYLSWVWGISISLHAPATHIQIIMGLAVGIYILGYLYGFFFRTHFVESSSFIRLEGAVEFSFQMPEGFEDFRAA